MAVHRRYDIPAIVIVVICVATYAAFRSEFHLRPAMPADFFDASHVPTAKRAAEERVARAYWRCAVTQIQWKYGYAHRLPENPPIEFSVTAEEVGSAAGDAAARARYWQRLHDLWGVSAVWQEQYEWDTTSLKESLQSAGQWLEQHMRRIIRYT